MGRIAINGLGRIGRAALKIALDARELEVVAVNDLVAPDNLAYLLKYDSVYGRYDRQVRAENDRLNVGTAQIRMFSSKDPVELPWKDLGVEVALECTGRFTTREGLEKHLTAGAKYAVLSAPSKDDGMKFVVPGVNHADRDDRLCSMASCTTNCITPVVEIIKRHFGVRKAVMTTIHAYTSTQQIVDGPAKKVRRGRAGAMNLVPTTTGAAKATTKVIPELDGLFDGVAVRAPVPVGSVADMVFVVDKSVTVDAVNQVMREESESERYRAVLGVSDDYIVSSDIIQDPRASVVDLTMTKAIGGDLVKVMSWYDNEWGYAAQMIREATRISRFLS